MTVGAAGNNADLGLEWSPAQAQQSPTIIWAGDRPSWAQGDSLPPIHWTNGTPSWFPPADAAPVSPVLLGGRELPFLTPDVAFQFPAQSATPPVLACVDPNAGQPNACMAPPAPAAPAAAAQPGPPRQDPARQRFQGAMVSAGEAASFDRQTRCIAHGSALENDLIRAFGLNPEQPDAVQILQREVGAFPDGKIGPQTVNAIARYFRQHAAEISIANPEQLVAFERMVPFINQAALQSIPPATVDRVRSGAMQGFDAAARTRYTQAVANEQLNPAGPRHVTTPQA